MRIRILSNHRGLAAAIALALTLGWATAGGEAVYPTPDEAVSALLEALATPGQQALSEVLGPKLEDLASGDPVADANDRKAFTAAAAQGTELEPQGEDRLRLLVGEDRYPFAIPLMRDGAGWRFDTDEGREVLKDRRIGRNELHTIATLRAYVEAQYEYAAEDRDGKGRQYARHLRSAPGTRDGLYWETGNGEPQSPMGPLVAQAASEGYTADNVSPYHGYLFLLLTAQGPTAAGGTLDYFDKDGRLTRGFAAMAYPARYGQSGVMSFLVNQRGLVYQKDLGPDTPAIAKTIAAFDPGLGWEPVTGE